MFNAFNNLLKKNDFEKMDMTTCAATLWIRKDQNRVESD